jgi:cell division septum initiation protein DivIVA
MDLTPETFEKVTFEEKRGGYNVDQVERFLEETGTEFAQMLARFNHTSQLAAAAEERAAAAEARLAQADTVLAEATERVQRAERAARAAQQQAAEAQATATDAVARDAASSSMARANEEQEVEQAAKTLLMAHRTAEATVNEARGQAQSLLEDSSAKAERQQAESTAQAEEMVRAARVKAEEEYASRRAEMIAEVSALESRRAQLEDVMTQLEARLDGYRSELARTAEELSSLATDPAKLGQRPGLSIPADEVLTAGQGSVATSTGNEGLLESDPLSGAEPTAVDAAAEQYLEGAEDEASDSGSADFTTGDAGTPDSGTPDSGIPDSSPSQGGAQPFAESSASDEYLDLTAGSESSTSGDGAADTWGPGSWSRVESDLPPQTDDSMRASDSISTTAATSTVGAVPMQASVSLLDAETKLTDTPQDERIPEVSLAWESEEELTDSRPTQAVDAVAGADQPKDRFMQELDDAVNDTGVAGTETAGDEAMTAFFEGNSDSKARRFGWRR